MASRTVDLAVIGAGAAGLAAAQTGVRQGVETVLIEAERPGGDCTFTGCVPSKTLLAEAARGRSYAEAIEVVRETIAAIAATEDEAALARHGIEVVTGRARFTAPRQLDVGGTTIVADRVVIATGSRPAQPAIDKWVEDVTKKGHDGKALLAEARALIAKHSK